MTVHVDRRGRVTFIYTDGLAGLLELGASTVRRASHVEPAAAVEHADHGCGTCGREPDGDYTVGCPECFEHEHAEPDRPGGWTADLAPLSGPVLGPYRLRADALAAELAWIDDRLAGGSWSTGGVT